MKNPFVARTHWGAAIIGFQVPNKVEPLWWTGHGFKDLTRVQVDPMTFTDEATAEMKIRDELIEFIRQWRADQAELIEGW